MSEELKKLMEKFEQLGETQETTGFPNSAKIARQCAKELRETLAASEPLTEQVRQLDEGAPTNAAYRIWNDLAEFLAFLGPTENKYKAIAKIQGRIVEMLNNEDVAQALLVPSAPFSYKDSNIRDTATAKAILLARIDEAQLLYDVTRNTPGVHKGLVQFMDRHLDDLRSKKVNGPAEPAPKCTMEESVLMKTGVSSTDIWLTDVPFKTAEPVQGEVDLPPVLDELFQEFDDSILLESPRIKRLLAKVRAEVRAQEWDKVMQAKKSGYDEGCALELSIWLPAHDATVRTDRDMDWWQAIVLVDNVAPTPEAAKEWLTKLSKHEQEQVRVKALEEAAQESVKHVSCPDHGKNRHHDCIHCHNCGNVYRAIRALAAKVTPEQKESSDGK